MQRTNQNFISKLNFISFLIYTCLLPVVLNDLCVRYENGRCVQCIDGYIIKNGYCNQCVNHCLKCKLADWSINGMQCLQCAPGYYLDRYVGCQSCGENCITCIPMSYGRPTCTSCYQGYRLSELNGKGYCEKIINIWPILLGFGIGLFIFFYIVIKCVLRDHHQTKRNYLFSLKINEQTPLYINTPSKLSFSLELKSPAPQPSEYQLSISVEEELTATVKFNYSYTQRVGNTVYQHTRTGSYYLEKARKIAEKQVKINGSDFIDNKYNGQIDFVSKIHHGFSVQHCFEARVLLKIKIRRSDWQRGEWAYVKSQSQCYYDSSKYKFSSDVLNIEMREGFVEAALRKGQLTYEGVRQYHKYYGIASLKFYNRTENKLKISYKLQKTYTSKFNWHSVCKFNKYTAKQSVYIQPNTEKRMRQLQSQKPILEQNKQKQVTFSLSECYIYQEDNFLTSTPLMLAVWVRPTGFFSWLFSVFVTRKYSVPIIMEPI